MVRMKLPLFLYLSLSLGGSRALFAASQTEKVVIGTVASVSDAGIYVGIAKGFFKEFGLQLEPGVFDSGSNQVALLAAGKIDVAGGTPAAGLFTPSTRASISESSPTKALTRPATVTSHF